jgi:hypothetical protein
MLLDRHLFLALLCLVFSLSSWSHGEFPLLGILSTGYFVFRYWKACAAEATPSAEAPPKAD